jgi:hypothetical protein
MLGRCGVSGDVYPHAAAVYSDREPGQVIAMAVTSTAGIASTPPFGPHLRAAEGRMEVPLDPRPCTVNRRR